LAGFTISLTGGLVSDASRLHAAMASITLGVRISLAETPVDLLNTTWIILMDFFHHEQLMMNDIVGIQ
jgi:hypothetical protein